MKTKVYFFGLLMTCISCGLYAQNFKFDTKIIEDWVRSAWRNQAKMEATYNAQGVMTQENSYEWDTVSSVWIKMVIMTNTLNGDGTVAEMVVQAYDTDLKMWSDFGKIQYTYDGSKNILTETTYLNMAGWWLYSKITKEYNAGNQLIKETGQMLDLNSMQLENSDLTTHTYNADGTENQSIQQAWNSATSSWVNTGRTTYSYDASKKVTSILDEFLLGSSWVKDSKISYTYNADNTNKETLGQSWNLVTTTWDNEWRDIYTYSGGHLSQVLSQEWNATASQWENYIRTSYTYTSTGIRQQIVPGNNLVRVYPNPFTGEINIESNGPTSAKYAIFNAQGQMVFSSLLTGVNTKLNLESLESGVYFLKMNRGNNGQTIKMIKIR